MIITQLRYDSGKNRFVVDTEGPRYLLSYDTVNKYDLQKDMDITTLQSVFSEETERMKAIDYVLRMLSSRAASSHEVKARLLRRNTSAAVTEEVLDYFRRQNLLDDQAFLTGAVRDQIFLKSYGPWRIVANLRQKGYEKDAILKEYEKHTNAEEESLRARTYAESQWPRIRGKTLRHRQKKMSDRLLRQGFSYDIISDILENLEE